MATHGTRGVYAIRNRVTGEQYIGQSRNIETRWHGHLRHLRACEHTNTNLQAAWEEYGEGAFDLAILEVVPLTKSLLNREADWIEREKPAYNTMAAQNDKPLPPRHTWTARDGIAAMRSGKAPVFYCLECGATMNLEVKFMPWGIIPYINGNAAPDAKVFVNGVQIAPILLDGHVQVND